MFKVGDIVTPIKDSGTHRRSYEKGKKYKVIKVFEGDNAIQTTDEKCEGWDYFNDWRSKFFVLVSSSDEELKNNFYELFDSEALK